MTTKLWITLRNVHTCTHTNKEAETFQGAGMPFNNRQLGQSLSIPKLRLYCFQNGATKIKATRRIPRVISQRCPN